MKYKRILKNALALGTVFTIQSCQLFFPSTPDPIEPTPFAEPTTPPINDPNTPNLFKLQFGPGTKGLKQEFGPGSKGLSQPFGPGSKGLETPFLINQFGPGTKGLGRLYYNVNFTKILLRENLADFQIQQISNQPLKIDTLIVKILNQSDELMAQVSFLPKASQITLNTQFPAGTYQVYVEALDQQEIIVSETTTFTINGSIIEDNANEQSIKLKKSELRVELSAEELLREKLDINILTRSEK